MSLIDAAIRMTSAYGQPMTLRRIATGVAPIDVAVFGFISGASSADPAPGVQQQQREIRISNREIAETSWPGPPRINDRITVGSASYTIEVVDTRPIGGVVALHIMTVRGA